MTEGYIFIHVPYAFFLSSHLLRVSLPSPSMAVIGGMMLIMLATIIDCSRSFAYVVYVALDCCCCIDWIHIIRVYRDVLHRY